MRYVVRLDTSEWPKVVWMVHDQAKPAPDDDRPLFALEQKDLAYNIRDALTEAFADGYSAGYNEGVLNSLPEGQRKDYSLIVASPIEALGLSKRSQNRLKRDGIDYVQQLLNKTEEDLKEIWNLGEKSLDEIKQNLHSHNLSLRGTPQ